MTYTRNSTCNNNRNLDLDCSNKHQYLHGEVEIVGKRTANGNILSSEILVRGRR